MVEESLVTSTAKQHRNLATDEYFRSYSPCSSKLSMVWNEKLAHCSPILLFLPYLFRLGNGWKNTFSTGSCSARKIILLWVKICLKKV